MMNMFLHMYTFCMHKLQNKKQTPKKQFTTNISICSSEPWYDMTWCDLYKSMLLSTLFFPDFITVSITTRT